MPLIVAKSMTGIRMICKADLFQHKVGAAVTEARRGGALTTLDAMYHFFMLQNMFVVGFSYWAMAYLLKALEERRNGQ